MTGIRSNANDSTAVASVAASKNADDSMAVASLAASKTAFATLLATLPGAALYEHPDVCWLDTGLPDSVFNGVYRAQAHGEELPSVVARVTAHFRRRALPFHWELGLRGEPAQAGEILAQHGLRHNEDEPGMWLDLCAQPDSGPAIAGLSIRPVTDPDLLRQWMRVWGCGAPSDVTERWYRAYAGLPYGPDGSLRMFIGFLHGRPVSTAYVFLAADVAAVHYVVTLPAFRRHGIGTAMTDRAVREARAAGCRIAVVTAAPLGIEIYRRMGFRQCCLVRTYEWQPDYGR